MSAYRKKERVLMKRYAGLTFLLLMLVLSGCATSQQAGGVETRGFLGDYSKLKPGGSDEAALIYRNPNVDWRKYDKFMIDPVKIWDMGNESLKDVPLKDRERLALMLKVRVIEALKNERFSRVKEPGPGVMRIRSAITEAQQSKPFLDSITTLLPQARLLSGAKKLAFGTNSFVGSASVEAEVTDSQTGEVLVAGVDRRAGGKTLEGSLNSWDDVEKSFKFWADRFAYRLCMAKGKKYCVPPE